MKHYLTIFMICMLVGLLTSCAGEENSSNQKSVDAVEVDSAPVRTEPLMVVPEEYNVQEQVIMKLQEDCTEMLKYLEEELIGTERNTEEFNYLKFRIRQIKDRC